MNECPEEIHLLIFSYLSRLDKCITRLVCYDWYRIIPRTRLNAICCLEKIIKEGYLNLLQKLWKKLRTLRAYVDMFEEAILYNRIEITRWLITQIPFQKKRYYYALQSLNQHNPEHLKFYVEGRNRKKFRISSLVKNVYVWDSPVGEWLLKEFPKVTSRHKNCLDNVLKHLFDNSYPSGREISIWSGYGF